MSVSVQDVRHIAALARLALDDERARAATAELNTILDHMEMLSRVDTAGVTADVATTVAPAPLRPDHGPPIALGAPPDVFAPAMRDGFFLVPRLATHENVESP